MKDVIAAATGVDKKFLADDPNSLLLQDVIKDENGNTYILTGYDDTRNVGTSGPITFTGPVVVDSLMMQERVLRRGSEPTWYLRLLMPMERFDLPNHLGTIQSSLSKWPDESP